MAAWIPIVLGALPAVISLIEGLFGPKQGPEKKNTVMELVTSVLGLLTTLSTGQQQMLWKGLAPLIPPIVEAIANALFPKGTTVTPAESVRLAARFLRGDLTPLETGARSYIDSMTEPVT